MRGRSFLKFGRSGKPHLVVIRLGCEPAPSTGTGSGAPAAAAIFWGKKSVAVSELVSVTAGRTGPVFERLRHDFRLSSWTSGRGPAKFNSAEAELLNSLSFSLVFASRSLDLQFPLETTGAAPASKKGPALAPAPAAALERVSKEAAERNAWVDACKWLQNHQTAAVLPASIVLPGALSSSTAHQQQQQMMQQLPQSPPSSSLSATGLPAPPSSSQPSSTPATPSVPSSSSSASSMSQTTTTTPPRSSVSASGNGPPPPPPADFRPDFSSASPVLQSLPSAVAAVSSSSSSSSTAAALSSSAVPVASSADSGISRPHNVVQTQHVGANFQWERERLDEESVPGHTLARTHAQHHTQS